jgi:ubiquinone/menaquinone biosynthesis C-methylase UbiE
MLANMFRRMKEGTEHLNYGREELESMARRHLSASDGCARVLDIGFGSGVDLLNIRRAVPQREVVLYGVDGYEPSVRRGSDLGINAFHVDIESQRLPFDDQTFDLVVANQVVEHTKDVFWIFSEMSRVTKPGGGLILGVPNLASLHSRILLLMGEQPSCIEMLGPHVRGITPAALERFVTADGYFRVLETRGSNFYPFPPRLAKVLSRLFPRLAVCTMMLIRRTDKPGRFIDVLRSRFYETNYRIEEANLGRK